MTEDSLTAPASVEPTTVNVEFTDWGIQLGRRTILTGINLHIRGPGVTVLMGPAGTGKSTLLKTLARQQSAHAITQGQININGQPLESVPIAPALAQQHPRELSFSVLETLVSAQRSSGASYTVAQMRQRATEILQTYQLDTLLEHFEQRLLDLPRELMRQALIIRAVLTGSSILLIDEPTSDLDAEQSAPILALIKQLAISHTCLVVLHHQQQARELADEVILLAGGHVQVAAENNSFFTNEFDHPVLAQFLRTGSCNVPSPDSRPEDLEPDAATHLAGETNDYESTAAPKDELDASKTSSATKPESSQPTASGAANPPDSPYELPPGVAHASRGPNGFHWLVPGKLAGCPMPGAVYPIEHDLALLRNVGITVLVNLTEQPMTHPAIAAAGLRTFHMGVEDRNAPPLMWMKMLLVKIERLIEHGEVVAVHCLAGLGRTGTVLGSWLINQGLTAEESLRRLRAIEPGFVQSTVQEDLLYELEINLLIRAPDL